MRILITGGSGFIGNNLVRQMIDSDAQLIVNVDRLSYASTLVEHREPKYRFHQVNLCDEKSLTKVFKQYEITHVMNLAAESHVDRSNTASGVNEFIDSNVQGTLNLLKLSKDFGVKRFLQISTDEVYGTARPGIFFHERDAFAPRNPYAASKAAAEHLVMAYHHTHGLNIGITRCTNNYGPYQFAEKFVPASILNRLNGKPIQIYGNGLQRRDWIHVSDHCRALELVLRQGRNGESYNIAGDNEMNNLQIAHAICKATETDWYFEGILDRPGHDVRYALDSTKIKLLGFKNRVEFEDGLTSTVEWYKQKISNKVN